MALLTFSQKRDGSLTTTDLGLCCCLISLQHGKSRKNQLLPDSEEYQSVSVCPEAACVGFCFVFCQRELSAVPWKTKEGKKTNMSGFWRYLHHFTTWRFSGWFNLSGNAGNVGICIFFILWDQCMHVETWLCQIPVVYEASFQIREFECVAASVSKADIIDF